LFGVCVLVDQLFLNIRFPLINIRYLFEVAEKDIFIQSSRRAQIILLQAYRYHALAQVGAFL